jgi:hypothetical protein
MPSAPDHIPPANEAPPARPAIEFVGLRATYLRRTAIATVITLLLVAMTVAAYAPGGWAWAGRYLTVGFWSMAFFGLIAPIFKALLFDRRVGRGLMLIGAKIVLLGALFVLCLHWSRSGINSLALATSVIGGILTLQAVIVLRAVGAMMQARARQAPNAPRRPADAKPAGTIHPAEPHS